MGMPRPLKRLLPLLIILFILLVGAGVFLIRPPVLLVTDASFQSLYGTLRNRVKQVEVSFRLRRWVRMVQVAETASSDIVAITVKAAVRTPYAVLFPYRYAGAARDYQEENPHIPAVILSGRIREDAVEHGPLVFRTSTEADFYRAGLCAAQFGTQDANIALVFQDGSITQADREAFSAGLTKGGSASSPVYLNSGSDYSAWQNVSCVIAVGLASRLFEQNVGAPILLFSWVNPRFTPRNVKLLFDDSPWALALQAVKAVEGGEKEGSLASELVIPFGRVSGRENILKLIELAKEEY
jgi:hypothetical protein